MKNDKRTGFLLGIFLPAIVLFFFYESTKASLNFKEYVGFLDTFQIITSVIALSAFANLATFFIALKKKLLRNGTWAPICHYLNHNSRCPI